MAEDAKGAEPLSAPVLGGQTTVYSGQQTQPSAASFHHPSTIRLTSSGPTSKLLILL